MLIRNTIVLGLALTLTGCLAHEGRYAPSCLAYAGSEIRLEGGQYVWTKFTDQVVVDELGNTVEPFPGFPRRGDYEKQGRQITLLGGEGEASETLALYRVDGAIYLYTAGEAAAFESTGERPACPLRLQAPEN